MNVIQYAAMCIIIAEYPNWFIWNVLEESWFQMKSSLELSLEAKMGQTEAIVLQCHSKILAHSHHFTHIWLPEVRTRD